MVCIAGDIGLTLHSPISHLRLPDKDAVVRVAGEVRLALDGPVVFPLLLVQNDADPLPCSNQRK